MDSVEQLTMLAKQLSQYVVTCVKRTLPRVISGLRSPTSFHPSVPSHFMMTSNWKEIKIQRLN